MAFDISARVVLSGPENIDRIVGDIRNKIGKVTSGTVSLELGQQSIQSINQLNASINQLNATIQSYNTNATQAARATQNLVGQTQTAATAITNVTTSMSRFSGSIRDTSKLIEESSHGFHDFGEQIGYVIRRFSAYTIAASAVLGTVYALKQGIQEAAKFQSEMVRLAQVSDDSTSKIRSIQSEITKLATTYGVSSLELAQTAVTIRQAGFSALETAKAMQTLAQAATSPNFDTLAKNAEGAIAIMNQFKIPVDRLNSSFSSINAVAAEFAVSAKDIQDAVVRSGGVFSALGGNLNEFIALFTSIKHTTQESSESIATGLRTIFARLQSRSTLDALQEMRVQLRYTAAEARALGDINLTSQFVKPYEAIQRISQALRNLPSTDPRYERILEAIGGTRQLGRALPLIRESGTQARALAVAEGGGQSLGRSAEQGLASVERQVTRVTERFHEMFRVIFDSEGFQVMAKGFLAIADSVGKLLTYLAPAIPLLTTFAGIKIGEQLGPLVSSAYSRAFYAAPPRKYATGGVASGPSLLTPGEVVLEPQTASKAGYANLHAFNSGGGAWIVPGHGNSDTEFHHLQTGSFVIRKDSVKKAGAQNILKLAHGTMKPVDKPASASQIYEMGNVYLSNNNYDISSENTKYLIGLLAENEELRQYISQDSSLLGKGAEAYAFKQNNKVLRVAPIMHALDDIPPPYNASFFENQYKRYRPPLKGVLQAENYALVGNEFPILLENLPFVDIAYSRLLEGRMSDTKKRSSVVYLLKLLKSQGYTHNDLHSDNWGFLNNRPIITDPGGLYKLPPSAKLASGGIFRPQKPITDKEIGALYTHFAQTKNISGDYGSLLLDELIDNQAISHVPSGSEFLGSGLTALAFRQPTDGNVLRLQPFLGARPLPITKFPYSFRNQLNAVAKKMKVPLPLTTEPFGNTFNYARPNLPQILPSLNNLFLGEAGSSRGRTLIETLPYAPSYFDLYGKSLNQDKFSSITESLTEALAHDGYIAGDLHSGNVAPYQGRNVLIDVGGLSKFDFESDNTNLQDFIDLRPKKFAFGGLEQVLRDNYTGNETHNFNLLQELVSGFNKTHKVNFSSLASVFSVPSLPSLGRFGTTRPPTIGINLKRLDEGMFSPVDSLLNNGNINDKIKYVLGHELGHAMDYHLTGLKDDGISLYGDYNFDLVESDRFNNFSNLYTDILRNITPLVTRDGNLNYTTYVTSSKEVLAEFFGHSISGLHTRFNLNNKDSLKTFNSLTDRVKGELFSLLPKFAEGTNQPLPEAFELAPALQDDDIHDKFKKIIKNAARAVRNRKTDIGSSANLSDRDVQMGFLSSYHSSIGKLNNELESLGIDTKIFDTDFSDKSMSVFFGKLFQTDPLKHSKAISRLQTYINQALTFGDSYGGLPSADALKKQLEDVEKLKTPFLGDWEYPKIPRHPRQAILDFAHQLIYNNKSRKVVEKAIRAEFSVMPSTAKRYAREAFRVNDDERVARLHSTGQLDFSRDVYEAFFGPHADIEEGVVIEEPAKKRHSKQDVLDVAFEGLNAKYKTSDIAQAIQIRFGLAESTAKKYIRDAKKIAEPVRDERLEELGKRDWSYDVFEQAYGQKFASGGKVKKSGKTKKSKSWFSNIMDWLDNGPTYEDVEGGVESLLSSLFPTFMGGLGKIQSGIQKGDAWFENTFRVDRTAATIGRYGNYGLQQLMYQLALSYDKPKFASGGQSISPLDTIPALLTPGEAVIRPEIVSKYGSAAFERLNKTGSLDHFPQVRGYNRGGIVSRFAQGGIGENIFFDENLSQKAGYNISREDILEFFEKYSKSSGIALEDLISNVKVKDVVSHTNPVTGKETPYDAKFTATKADGQRSIWLANTKIKSKNHLFSVLAHELGHAADVDIYKKGYASQKDDELRKLLSQMYKFRRQSEGHRLSDDSYKHLPQEVFADLFREELLATGDEKFDKRFIGPKSVGATERLYNKEKSEAAGRAIYDERNYTYEEYRKQVEEIKKRLGTQYQGRAANAFPGTYEYTNAAKTEKALEAARAADEEAARRFAEQSRIESEAREASQTPAEKAKETRELNDLFGTPGMRRRRKSKKPPNDEPIVRYLHTDNPQLSSGYSYPIGPRLSNGPYSDWTPTWGATSPWMPSQGQTSPWSPIGANSPWGPTSPWVPWSGKTNDIDLTSPWGPTSPFRPTSPWPRTPRIGDTSPWGPNSPWIPKQGVTSPWSPTWGATSQWPRGELTSPWGPTSPWVPWSGKTNDIDLTSPWGPTSPFRPTSPWPRTPRIGDTSPWGPNSPWMPKQGVTSPWSPTWGATSPWSPIGATSQWPRIGSTSPWGPNSPWMPSQGQTSPWSPIGATSQWPRGELTSPWGPTSPWFPKQGPTSPWVPTQGQTSPWSPIGATSPWGPTSPFYPAQGPTSPWRPPQQYGPFQPQGPNRPPLPGIPQNGEFDLSKIDYSKSRKQIEDYLEKTVRNQNRNLREEEQDILVRQKIVETRARIADLANKELRYKQVGYEIEKLDRKINRGERLEDDERDRYAKYQNEYADLGKDIINSRRNLRGRARDGEITDIGGQGSGATGWLDRLFGRGSRFETFAARLSAGAGLLSVAGSLAAQAAMKEAGSPDEIARRNNVGELGYVGGKSLSAALMYGSLGAGIGSAFTPAGAVIGAGIGAVYGGITGAVEGKREIELAQFPLQIERTTKSLNSFIQSVDKLTNRLSDEQITRTLEFSGDITKSGAYEYSRQQSSFFDVLRFANPWTAAYTLASSPNLSYTGAQTVLGIPGLSDSTRQSYSNQLFANETAEQRQVRIQNINRQNPQAAQAVSKSIDSLIGNLLANDSNLSQEQIIARITQNRRFTSRGITGISPLDALAANEGVTGQSAGLRYLVSEAGRNRITAIQRQLLSSGTTDETASIQYGLKRFTDSLAHTAESLEKFTSRVTNILGFVSGGTQLSSYNAPVGLLGRPLDTPAYNEAVGRVTGGLPSGIGETARLIGRLNSIGPDVLVQYLNNIPANGLPGNVGIEERLRARTQPATGSVSSSVIAQIAREVDAISAADRPRFINNANAREELFTNITGRYVNPIIALVREEERIINEQIKVQQQILNAYLQRVDLVGRAAETESEIARQLAQQRSIRAVGSPDAYMNYFTEAQANAGFNARIRELGSSIGLTGNISVGQVLNAARGYQSGEVELRSFGLPERQQSQLLAPLQAGLVTSVQMLRLFSESLQRTSGYVQEQLRLNQAERSDRISAQRRFITGSNEDRVEMLRGQSFYEYINSQGDFQNRLAAFNNLGPVNQASYLRYTDMFSNVRRGDGFTIGQEANRLVSGGIDDDIMRSLNDEQTTLVDRLTDIGNQQLEAINALSALNFEASSTILAQQTELNTTALRDNSAALLQLERSLQAVGGISQAGLGVTGFAPTIFNPQLGTTPVPPRVIGPSAVSPPLASRDQDASYSGTGSFFSGLWEASRYIPSVWNIPRWLSSGGPVYANNGFFVPRGTDTVPAMLTPNEFVINRESAIANRPLIEAINNARGPLYRAGGGIIDNIIDLSPNLNFLFPRQRVSVRSANMRPPISDRTRAAIREAFNLGPDFEPLSETTPPINGGNSPSSILLPPNPYGVPNPYQPQPPNANVVIPPNPYGVPNPYSSTPPPAIQVPPVGPPTGLPAGPVPFFGPSDDEINEEDRRRQNERIRREWEENERQQRAGLRGALGLGFSPLGLHAASSDGGGLAAALLYQAGATNNLLRRQLLSQGPTSNAYFGIGSFGALGQSQRLAQEAVFASQARYMREYIERGPNPILANLRNTPLSRQREPGIIGNVNNSNIIGRQGRPDNLLEVEDLVRRAQFRENNLMGVRETRIMRDMRGRERVYGLNPRTRQWEIMPDDVEGFRRARELRGFATGGLVTGPDGHDVIPAMLSNGEFVFNNRAVRNLGANNLAEIQRFAEGGLVGSSGNNVNSVSAEAQSAFTELNEALNAFSRNNSELIEALKAFPHTIQMEATHQVNVNINGAAAIAQLENSMKEMVVSQIEETINNFVKTKLPDLQ